MSSNNVDVENLKNFLEHARVMESNCNDVYTPRLGRIYAALKGVDELEQTIDKLEQQRSIPQEVSQTIREMCVSWAEPNSNDAGRARAVLQWLSRMEVGRRYVEIPKIGTALPDDSPSIPQEVVATIKAALENCPGILTHRKGALAWLKQMESANERT